MGEDGFLSIDEDSKNTVFESLIGKAREADEDVEKNAKKNRKRFVELLQKSREVTAHTTYEDAEKLLSVSSAWDSIDVGTRRQCFDIFVDQLKIQSQAADDVAGSGDDERKKDKKSKGKKRKEEPPEEEVPRKKSKREEVVEEKKHKKHRRE